MSYNAYTATTQSCDLASSLLNTTFVPATEPSAPRSRRNREKKYPCSWQGCDRFFECRHNVQQHIREAHTLEKPYGCDLCAAEGAFSAFSRQYGLNRHMRQVHSIVMQAAKPASNSAASNPGVAAGHQWVNQSQIIVNDEFADVGVMLAQANFEMDNASSDVEMSDGQFHFDTEPSDMDFAGVQQLTFACDECGYASAAEEHIFMHMHGIHKCPNTRFCACQVCTTMFSSSEVDAMNHAAFMRNGAFHMPSDAKFAQDGPNITTTLAWSSQQGPGNAIGWDSIDPALLSSSGT